MSQRETPVMGKDEVITAAGALSRVDLWDVCWKLMDLRGIVPFVAFSIEDVREDLEQREYDGEIQGADRVTDEQILGAIQTAADGDWSDVSTAAREAIMRAVDEEIFQGADHVAA